MFEVQRAAVSCQPPMRGVDPGRCHSAARRRAAATDRRFGRGRGPRRRCRDRRPCRARRCLVTSARLKHPQTVTAGSGSRRFRRATEPSWSCTLAGRTPASRPRWLQARRSASTFQMKMVAFEENVSMPGQLILDAQARALNQQKTAPNITNVVSADQIGSFPGPQRRGDDAAHSRHLDHQGSGRGRYVNIRGTEPRLNSMMINGERIPSPDPLIRQVALDVIPSDLLQAIEVSKALTPDMDADSIGGSVNLVMKQAPEKLRLFGAIGGGYNDAARQLRAEHVQPDDRASLQRRQSPALSFR